MDIPPLILVIYDKSNISVVLSLFTAKTPGKGINTNALTDEQSEYMNSWEEGTKIL